MEVQENDIDVLRSGNRLFLVVFVLDRLIIIYVVFQIFHAFVGAEIDAVFPRERQCLPRGGILEIQGRFRQFDIAVFEVAVEIDQCLAVIFDAGKLVLQALLYLCFVFETFVLKPFDPRAEILLYLGRVRDARLVVAVVIVVEIDLHLLEIPRRCCNNCIKIAEDRWDGTLRR